MKSVLTFIHKNFFSILFLVAAFIFSWWLMFSTFSYSHGTIFVASKAWSDFGSHIPLIRSFSFGWNFPPEYPLFAGEPIHYHFLFYAFVGFLERIGVPLDIALNTPSALLFFSLLVMLYIFAVSLFKSRLVGFLSVVFFIFNGSFSFLYYFKDNAFSLESIKNITTNTTFTSFHPYYGDGLVSAFWNLNIYTNQRHLAAAFAFSLAVIYIFLKPILKDKTHESITITILLGFLLGLSFYFHLAAFGMTLVTIALLSILFPKIRSSGLTVILLSLLIAFPQYKYMNQNESAFSLLLKFGYLTPEPVELLSFLNYWTLNIGLHLVLIPVGFLLATKKAKKIFIAFFSFFIIGNVFQFSPEMAANHKFFNYFMLIGGMFSAYTIFRIWKKNIFLKLSACVLVFFLILSGVMDIFPIYNDTKASINDYQKNPDISWIKTHTPQEAVFLNTSYFLPSESLAGRKIFLGWPYFAWSQGYDTNTRSLDVKNMLSSNNKLQVCSFLQRNNLYGIILTQESQDFPYSKEWFLSNFKPAYTSTENIVIYAKNNCTF